MRDFIFYQAIGVASTEGDKRVIPNHGFGGLFVLWVIAPLGRGPPYWCWYVNRWACIIGQGLLETGLRRDHPL